ncbi:DsrE family protein [Hafnia alvei]|uniref:DsrE family protein n=1 Tax=Hafnia alvei TaxID=569 RepID=UPI0028BEA242|nr:DsrE family protein [Hafnia alvei]WNN53660.1 DsrE family protein [Hafnia alvei]
MKVVFHVSESTHCIPAFNSATNLLKARNGKYTDIHIVFTGSAISTLIADSDESPNWETLQQANVILLACENAMRANSITLDRLLMGVTQFLRAYWHWLNTSKTVIFTSNLSGHFNSVAIFGGPLYAVSLKQL